MAEKLFARLAQGFIVTTHEYKEGEVDLIVHNGQFHLDDCLCVVILALLLGRPVRVLRTRDREIIAAAQDDPSVWVADVGMVYDSERKCFDHHQSDCPSRVQDRGKYAAAGLMWREYGRQILCQSYYYPARCADPAYASQEAVERVDREFIAPSDRIDNGNWEFGQQVSDLVLASNPPAGASEDEVNAAFVRACQLAFLAFTAEVQDSWIYGQEAAALNEVACEPGATMLDLGTPQVHWGTLIPQAEWAEDLLYVLWQGAGQYEARGVPRSASREDIMHPRKPFPAAWRGLAGPKLAEVTGVEDALFCHPGGFFACAKSREGAWRLAELAAAYKEEQ